MGIATGSNGIPPAEIHPYIHDIFQAVQSQPILDPSTGYTTVNPALNTVLYHNIGSNAPVVHNMMWAGASFNKSVQMTTPLGVVETYTGNAFMPIDMASTALPSSSNASYLPYLSLYGAFLAEKWNPGFQVDILLAHPLIPIDVDPTGYDVVEGVMLAIPDFMEGKWSHFMIVNDEVVSQYCPSAIESYLDRLCHNVDEKCVAVLDHTGLNTGDDPTLPFACHDASGDEKFGNGKWYCTLKSQGPNNGWPAVGTVLPAVESRVRSKDIAEWCAQQP